MSSRRRAAQRRRQYGRPQPPDESGWYDDNSSSLLLQIPGIKGECELPGFEGAIELMSWSFYISKQSQTKPLLPMRIRAKKIENKKKYLAKHGFTLSGETLEQYEKRQAYLKRQREKKMKAKENKSTEPSVASSTNQEHSDFDVDENEIEVSRQLYYQILEEYDSEAEIRNEEFKDEEIPNRKIPRPQLSDFSVTKYSDSSSPQIQALALGARTGVDMTFSIVKSRVRTLTKEEEEEKKRKSEEKKQKEEERRKKEQDDEATISSTGYGFGGFTTGRAPPIYATGFSNRLEEDQNEEDQPREYHIAEQYVLHSAFISTISTSGGGGQATESISISCNGYQYTFTDVYAKYEHEHGKVDSSSSSSSSSAAALASLSSSSSSSSSSSTAAVKTFERGIIYDGVRNVVCDPKAAIRSELAARDQLRPVDSVVLGYL